MAYDQAIIDFVAERWTPQASNPERPPVREDGGRGIALPAAIGEHPWRFTSIYLRKVGSEWDVEPGSFAFDGEGGLHQRALRIVRDLQAAGY